MANPYKDLISGKRSYFLFATASDENKWLISQLTNRNSRARWNAACLLGKIKCQESIPALIIALQDEHWLVRLHAAKALGIMRNKQAIEPLRGRLQDDCPYVQRQVRIALGIIGTESIVFHPTHQERVYLENRPIALKRQLPPVFDINRNEINNIKKGISWFAVGLVLFFSLVYVVFRLDKSELIPFFLIPIVFIVDNLKVIVGNALAYSKKRAWIRNAVRVHVPIVDRIIETDDYAETWEAYSNCELAVKHSCPTVNSTYNQIIWAKVSDYIYHKYESQDFAYIFYDSQNPYAFAVEGE